MTGKWFYPIQKKLKQDLISQSRSVSMVVTQVFDEEHYYQRCIVVDSEGISRVVVFEFNKNRENYNEYHLAGLD